MGALTVEGGRGWVMAVGRGWVMAVGRGWVMAGVSAAMAMGIARVTCS
jgi:hypothetical protein